MNRYLEAVPEIELKLDESGPIFWILLAVLLQGLRRVLILQNKGSAGVRIGYLLQLNLSSIIFLTLSETVYSQIVYSNNHKENQYRDKQIIQHTALPTYSIKIALPLPSIVQLHC